MSKIIRQYKHYPNSTELGQGNTHETYFRISKCFDLSTIFPPGVAVEVYDLRTLKRYELKSSSGREFRLNQLGEIYRDYGVMPGDEIILTSIEVNEESMVSLVVNTFNRIVFDCTDDRGVKILNGERLPELGSIELEEPTKTLEIQHVGKEKKRNDSPNETDFYKVSINGEDLPKKKYFLTLGENNTLVEAPNNDLTIIADESCSTSQNNTIPSLQTIFFGAPGSGKSHEVKRRTQGKSVHRTTFHPDSDYASFVGCYKPIMKTSVQDILSLDELIQRIPEVQGEDNAIGKFTIKYYRSIQKLQETPDKQDLRKRIQEAKGANSDGASQYAYMNQAISLGIYLDKEGLWRDNSTISYSFIPQVFTDAYVEAWKKHTDASLEDKDVYLVIEEINRGNCAQIFGDLFQLLDRNSEGRSDYPITADRDLRDYLARELGSEHEGIKNGKLCLPPNLYILATMNTSDQSLFPMDSAFKRRWDWKYVPIDYSEDIDSGDYRITLGDKQYLWVDFLKEVNKRIREVTDSEDKQMGNFFIKGDVSENEFRSKVMFFLWNEVCRDEYHTQNNFFRCKDANEEREFSFNDLYNKKEETDENGKKIEKGLKLLHGFMDYLELKAMGKGEEVEDEANKDEQGS